MTSGVDPRRSRRPGHHHFYRRRRTWASRQPILRQALMKHPGGAPPGQGYGVRPAARSSVFGMPSAPGHAVGRPNTTIAH